MFLEPGDSGLFALQYLERIAQCVRVLQMKRKVLNVSG